MSKSSMAALFGSDPEKETKGIVVEYGPIRVRLARLGPANKKFAAIFEEKMRPYRRMIANELLDEAISKKVVYESFAEAIVMEWDGVTDDDGSAIEFTAENCVAQFNKWPEFFQFVREESSRLKNYRTASVETDVKN